MKILIFSALIMPMAVQAAYPTSFTNAKSIEHHGAEVTNDTLTLMLHWNLLDPVSEWECERNRRIEAAQGQGNHYVSDQCETQ